MPTLSMCYGIIIRMQSERGGKHHKPHIHCIFGDFEIVISLDGEILEGDMPQSKLKLILAWMEIHNDELAANWNMLSNGDGFYKIEPLR